MADATSKARSAYRIALRGIPDMRRNFTIIEDEALVRACIRDLFEKHRDVTEPHIVDMLVFKALQELREIGEQWKSRHHVTAYITRYSEKLIREETARRLEEDVPDASDKREETLRMWRERGIVPPEILTWGMFQRWKEEEDTKFKTFALENKLFSEEELDRNSKSSTCTIM